MSLLPVAEVPPDPDDRVAVLSEALQRLSGEARAVVSLKYLEGFDVEEIARILGVPEGTVKSRLHHARDRLRDIVERLTK